MDQLFARGQGAPLQQGPFLGGYVYKLASVAAGGSVLLANALRAVPRHAEVIAQRYGEYPSRVTITAATTAAFSVTFESAQSAGAFLWVW